MRLAHTVVVVSVPGLGDDVQALKAGLLEIADLHVVNKADREGADRTLGELRSMLTLLPPAESPAGPDGAPAGEPWVPPVLGASAAREEGIEALMDALDGHMAYLKTSGELDRRWRRMVGARVLKIAQELVARRLAHPAAADADVDRVARRELSPHACARLLLTRLGERTSHV